VKIEADKRFQALLQRDHRLEGRYYLANKTVKIYCCRICGAKAPLAKNVEIYTHPAGAEAAGYRPCKRCRPELAPGHTSAELKSDLARSLSFNLNQGYLAHHPEHDLAKKLGISGLQLQALSSSEFGVSPQQYWQTHRLLLAKQLLTDSAIPPRDVAKASGFTSVQELHAVLARSYRLQPSDFRRRQSKHAAKAFAEFSFKLSYRPPFDWAGLLNFLCRRAIPGVELVENGRYLRTVHIKQSREAHTGTVTVKDDPKNYRLLVQIAPSLLSFSPAVLERICWFFDLQADPIAIGKSLGSLAKKRPGLRLPGSFDAFEMAVRAILGQQISLAGGRTLIERFAVLFGVPLNTGSVLLTHVFPTPQRVARVTVDQIQGIGITFQRAKTILALARAMSQEIIILEPGMAPGPVIRKLQELPGIGEWTAHYIAMRALSWSDAFLHTDLVVRRVLGLKDSNKILKKAEAWKPYRAYALMHLWNEDGEVY
jgi:AraC family transcriptional regulator, regulatory protein of adaptative response / DNA-3-methyladenine glycosylase II